MRIVVIGGIGLVGSKLVSILENDGHEVVAASRRFGVDALTGEGLAAALTGASVVVDVSDSPSSDDAAAMAFFTTSTRHLLEYAAAAGVGHYLALSVVGAERIAGSGYIEAKKAQEALIAAAGVPYSIVRTTQFFEFLNEIARQRTDGPVVRLPPVLIQPIAADDVARSMARIATGFPLGGIVEVGGPERFCLDRLIQRFLGFRNDPRRVIADPHARLFAAALDELSLVPGDEAELGRIQFDEWLRRTTHPALKPDRHGAAGVAGSHERPSPPANEFRVDEVAPGAVLLLGDVAVFSIEGGFCATQARCTHMQGLLAEGTIDDWTVTCRLHGAQFDVWTGAVLRGPAKDPLKTFAVTIEGNIGRVEVPPTQLNDGAGGLAERDLSAASHSAELDPRCVGGTGCELKGERLLR